jgi:hypothetical protein
MMNKQRNRGSYEVCSYLRLSIHGIVQLVWPKGLDSSKDQSYFLSFINSQVLKQVRCLQVTTLSSAKWHMPLW